MAVRSSDAFFMLISLLNAQFCPNLLPVSVCLTGEEFGKAYPCPFSGRSFSLCASEVPVVCTPF